ncbi:nucleotidyl transferase AbiEii/AbiGii toxin family protein [Saccharicrinis sp. FJH2]|uniref:nucleotidyl transferase AbiEii/AbiGii toxin family protein n=1 Tax=Saccharicrinis sp. FJH65 TaxID=3344659 RepID=UPI0035F450D5
MSTLSQSYKELAIPYFKEVFDIIDEIMIKHAVPYYLIGVNALALELLKDGIKPGRGTKDIDFAIMISSFDEYEDISTSLQKKDFNKVKAPWTFYSDKYNVAIDILPFGEVEERDTLKFNERYSDLHVLGFKEILEDPEQVQIEEKIANIPPLPGMILLKLVAWSDRPEERGNDLADILKIIEHYFDYNFDEIVEHYNDTFSKDGFDHLLIAVEVLGRKSKKYLDKSNTLMERIKTVLENNLNTEIESDIAKEWARIKNWEIEYAFSILKSFQKGINEY